jgi:DNA-nicking Smr family endonuclease
MSKRDTLHSFQDIESSLFRDSREHGQNAPARPASRKKTAPQRDAPVADEAALFLEAVAGYVDISLKEEKSPGKNHPKRKKKGCARSRYIHAAAGIRAGSGTGDIVSGCTGAAFRTPCSSRFRRRTPVCARHGWCAPGECQRPGSLAPSSKPLPRIHEAYLQSMDDIFSGKLEFSLEYTDEFIQGHVVGVDTAIMGKLRAGAFSPEGHLDLHGQNLEQAYAALTGFIKHAYQSGKRHLLIITGRGKNSPGGTPVLRERVQTWFTRDPFKRVVLVFCTSKPSDGGAGALYVLLRKRKKNQGKIVWDRRPSEEELLL